MAKHYGRRRICRVPEALLSAKNQALSKAIFFQVLSRVALSKEWLCRVAQRA